MTGNRCTAHDDDKLCGKVATHWATNAITGDDFPVCDSHAELLRMLDNQSRDVYRMMSDPRANRPPLVRPLKTT